MKSKIAQLKEKAAQLQKAVAALYDLPLDQVTMDIYIHASSEATEAARQAGWERHEYNTSIWYQFGDSIHGVCISIFQPKVVVPGISTRRVPAKTAGKE